MTLAWGFFGFALWLMAGFAFAFVFGEACRLDGLHDPEFAASQHDPSSFDRGRAELDTSSESVNPATSRYA
jgi:hypothetical protein